MGYDVFIGVSSIFGMGSLTCYLAIKSIANETKKAYNDLNDIIPLWNQPLPQTREELMALDGKINSIMEVVERGAKLDTLQARVRDALKPFIAEEISESMKKNVPEGSSDLASLSPTYRATLYRRSNGTYPL